MSRPLDKKSLVLASHNAGKLAEFVELIAPFGIALRPIGDSGLPEPEETGETFEENAAIKALAAARATGEPALSDDSGLCVQALGGQPGVYTANWAETEDGTRDFMVAMQRTEVALQAVGATEAAKRAGKFVAVLCLAWPDGHTEHFRGEVDGVLVWPPRGEQGFGYDPVFLPDGHERTFGEMSSAEKHGWKPGSTPLSHRARAFKAFAGAKLGA